MEIKFTGTSPLEVLAEVAAFSTYCLSNQQVSDRANEIYVADTEKRSETSSAPPPATQTNPAPAPAVSAEKTDANTSKAAPDSATEPAPATTRNAVKVPTVEEVRDRGITFVKDHGKPGRAQIQTLLDKFHVSGMSELPESDRAAFLTELDKLEAANA